MRNAQKQEQLNHASLPECDLSAEEFTLESILAEFGSKPDVEQNQAPVPEESRSEVPETQAEPPTVAAPPQPEATAQMAQEAPRGEKPAQPKHARFQFIHMEPQNAAPPEEAHLPEEEAEDNAPQPQVQRKARATHPTFPDARQVEAPTAPQRSTAAPRIRITERTASAEEAAETRRARMRRAHAEKQAREAELRPEELFLIYRKQLGSGRLRLALCAALAGASVVLLLLQEWQLLNLSLVTDPYRLSLVLIGLMLCAAIVSYDTLALGVVQLLQLKPQLYTLLSFAVLTGTVDSFRALREGRLPYCTALTLAIFLASWAEVNRKMAVLNSLKVARSTTQPRGIFEISDSYAGTAGLKSGEGDLAQFMQGIQQPDLTQRVMRVYAPVAIALSLALAALIRTKHDVSFLWTLTVLLLGSLPVGGFLSFSRPYYRLSRRLAKGGAAISGWAGARAFGGKHVILVADEDIFTQNSVQLNGVKMLSGWQVTKVVSYAAAAISAADGALKTQFEELLQSEGGRHYPVDKFRYYESGGVGAEIMGDIVLLGSLDFMRAMGVHMQGGAKVRQAVYISVNGELAGIFALKYQKSGAIQRGLHAVANLRHFRIVLATRDFVVTPAFLRYKFGISPERVTFPSMLERVRLSAQDGGARGAQGAILAKDNFGVFADTAAGGRVLRSAVQIGTWLSVAAGVCGLVLTAWMAMLGAVRILSALNLLLLLVLWLIPCFVIQGWASHY